LEKKGIKELKIKAYANRVKNLFENKKAVSAQ
jgi:hypothetical protein